MVNHRVIVQALAPAAVTVLLGALLNDFAPWVFFAQILLQLHPVMQDTLVLLVVRTRRRAAETALLDTSALLALRIQQQQFALLALIAP